MTVLLHESYNITEISCLQPVNKPCSRGIGRSVIFVFDRFIFSHRLCLMHYSDIIMSVMASQITRSKETSKLCVTGLCEGNSAMTGEFPAQRASNTEHVSIWWRHHVKLKYARIILLNYWLTDHVIFNRKIHSCHLHDEINSPCPRLCPQMWLSRILKVGIAFHASFEYQITIFFEITLSKFNVPCKLHCNSWGSMHSLWMSIIYYL